MISRNPLPKSRAARAQAIISSLSKGSGRQPSAEEVRELEADTLTGPVSMDGPKITDFRYQEYHIPWEGLPPDAPKLDASELAEFMAWMTQPSRDKPGSTTQSDDTIPPVHDFEAYAQQHSNDPPTTGGRRNGRNSRKNPNKNKNKKGRHSRRRRRR